MSKKLNFLGGMQNYNKQTGEYEPSLVGPNGKVVTDADGDGIKNEASKPKRTFKDKWGKEHNLEDSGYEIVSYDGSYKIQEGTFELSENLSEDDLKDLGISPEEIDEIKKDGTIYFAPKQEEKDFNDPKEAIGNLAVEEDIERDEDYERSWGDDPKTIYDEEMGDIDYAEKSGEISKEEADKMRANAKERYEYQSAGSIKDKTADKGVKDEKEAINEYDKMIAESKNPHQDEQFKKIKKEEEAHEDFLDEVKKNPNATYNDPSEKANMFDTEEEWRNYIEPKIKERVEEYRAKGMDEKLMRAELNDEFAEKDLVEKYMSQPQQKETPEKEFNVQSRVPFTKEYESDPTMWYNDSMYDIRERMENGEIPVTYKDGEVDTDELYERIKGEYSEQADDGTLADMIDDALIDVDEKKLREYKKGADLKGEVPKYDELQPDEYDFYDDGNFTIRSRRKANSSFEEPSVAYDDVSRFYGIDLEKLIYGKGGYEEVRDKSDFAGDIIYSETEWGKFEDWLKDKYGVDLDQIRKQKFEDYKKTKTPMKSWWN